MRGGGGTAADDAGTAVDAGAGNQDVASTQCGEGIEHAARLVPRHALLAVGGVGEEAGFGEVGEGEVGLGHHLSHELDLALRDAVVEASAVAHDGVDVYGGAVGARLAAEVPDQPRLLLAEHQAGAYGVEAEAQLAPHGQRAAHVASGVEDIEVAVVQRVGHQRGGQVVDGMPLMGQDGQHGHHAHMAAAHDVVDEQYLFHLVFLAPTVSSISSELFFKLRTNVCRRIIVSAFEIDKTLQMRSY